MMVKWKKGMYYPISSFLREKEAVDPRKANDLVAPT